MPEGTATWLFLPAGRGDSGAQAGDQGHEPRASSGDSLQGLFLSSGRQALTRPALQESRRPDHCLISCDSMQVLSGAVRHAQWAGFRGSVPSSDTEGVEGAGGTWVGSRQQGPRSQDNEQQGRALSSWWKAEVGWGLLRAQGEPAPPASGLERHCLRSHPRLRSHLIPVRLYRGDRDRLGQARR